MPRIPVYNSRVSAPGPIPGLGNDLAAPGRALTRLGGAIVGFGEDLARTAARDKAAEGASEARAGRGEPQDESNGNRKSGNPETQEMQTLQAQGGVLAVLDQANDDALFSVLRADVLWQASLDNDPDQLVQRALSSFDSAAGKLIHESGDPARRARRETLARVHRAVLEKRGEQRGNRLMVPVLNERLETALGGFANAVRQDPAMLTAMLTKGTDTITASARLAGLGRERTEAMTQGWTKRAHVALVEGTIARDPALALASLMSGELDARLSNDTALLGRLTRQAESAKTVAEAAAKQQARAQRQLFELRKAEHLEAVRKTGRGDAEIAALAVVLLDPKAQAAFHEEVEHAEAHHAARNTYAFMTAQEIDADIRRPGLQNGTRRARGKAIRKAARDEIHAERTKDPAAWAMQDTTVAEALAAAEQALEAAQPDTPEIERAERAFRRALALRRVVQKDMGAEPRLLSEAEREALAAELQSLASAERLARIGGLRRRYGDHWPALARELSGRIDRDAGLLVANVEDAPLAGMLARGIGQAGDTGAEKSRPLPRRGPPRDLPKANGKADLGVLDPRYDYRIPAISGEAVVRPEGNALVFVAAGGEGGTDPTKPDADPVKQLEARIKTVPDMTDEAFRELQLDIARSGLTASGKARLQNAAAYIRAGTLDRDYAFSEQRQQDGATEAASTLKSVPRGVVDAAAVALSPEVLSQHLNRNQIRTMGLLIQGLAGGDEAALNAVLRIIHRAPNLTRVDRSFLSRAARDVQQSRLKPADVPEYVAQAERAWAADAQESLRAFGGQTWPIPPEHEENFSVKAGRAAGGMSVLLAARLFTGVPGVVVTAASMGSGEAIERAIAEGATDDEQRQAALLGAAVGLTDMVPIEKLLKPVRHIPGMEGALYAIARKAVGQGAFEGTQEAAQAFMQNMVAALTHSPEQDLTEGVAENGLVGFLVGTLFGGGAGAVQTERDGSGTSLDLDASVNGTRRDESQRAQYYDSALHDNFRNATEQKAEEGQAGQNAFGLTDPASGKPVIQPVNDADRMLVMAEENIEPLGRQLRELVAYLPGVEFSGARAKQPDRLGQKLAGGRRPDTLTDYLGGRIVVGDPQILDEAVRAITRRYKNVEVDDFLDDPREIGYRAIHMQIVLDNGMTAEIQIMPSDILLVYQADHENYLKWRDKIDLTEDEAREREADKAWAQHAYADAYERWLQRANAESTSP